MLLSYSLWLVLFVVRLGVSARQGQDRVKTGSRQCQDRVRTGSGQARERITTESGQGQDRLRCFLLGGVSGSRGNVTQRIMMSRCGEAEL